MNRFRHAVVLILLAFTTVVGQDQSGKSAGTYTFVPINGTVINHNYQNYILNFSYPIPDGWSPNREEAKTELENLNKSLPDGYLLFMADQHSASSFNNRLTIMADPAEGDRSSSRLEKYTGRLALQLAKKEGAKLVRDVIEFDLAGRRFIRADFDEKVAGGAYYALVCTKLNGYFLSWIFATGSEEGRNAAVNSLSLASFGNVTVTNPPVRLRASSAAAQSQLLTSIRPVYPTGARLARITGNVVIDAVISRTGDIQELTVVSGHPMLAQAAIESVKRWKYRPPMFNGAPVEVETRIIVNFQLSR